MLFPVGVPSHRAHVWPPGLEELKNSHPQTPFIHAPEFDIDTVSPIKEVIVSPGLCPSDPSLDIFRQKQIPIIGDVELFARKAKAPVVAITGTNGKGTITTLVGDMAKEAGLDVRVGGNIGTPILDLLSDKEPDLYVLELSSYQLETTDSLKPKVATVLNISADHMDRYHTLEAYQAAKLRVYHDAEIAVSNRDDKLTLPENPTQAHISFGSSSPQKGEYGLAEEGGRKWLAYENELLFACDELFIKGQHNHLNALAAFAIADSIKLPHEAIKQALKQFKGLPHRCQWVATDNNVDWYNDSKATNIGSVKAAIEGLGADLKGKIVWIAGGIGKEADFTVLQKPVSRFVRDAIFIGKDGPLLEKVFHASTSSQQAKTMEDAVKLASECAQPGDVVLLAPACSSFDMFDDFEHRGDVFMQEVRLITS